jgi:site-specific DNA recombinase
VISALAVPHLAAGVSRVRQDRHHDPQPTGRGRRRPAHQWNPIQDWAISCKIVHPPLVSEKDFIAVQAVRAAGTTGDGVMMCPRGDTNTALWHTCAMQVSM